jgi:hypothetical protein
MVWLGAEPPPGYEYLIGAEVSPRHYTCKKAIPFFGRPQIQRPLSTYCQSQWD